VYKNCNLDAVFGHGHCIGGSLELLAAGVPPEIIMKARGGLHYAFCSIGVASNLLFLWQ
jgi:hypothetical protein